MPPTLYFTWLGSKRAHKHNVAPIGSLLDKAARGGLPVPTGAIILDNFYRTARDRDVLQLHQNQITCPNPTDLYDLVYGLMRFPQINEPVTLQPAFSPHQLTPPYPWHPNQTTPPFDFLDENEIANHLCTLYTRAYQQNADRFDILLTTHQPKLTTNTVQTTKSHTRLLLGHHTLIPKLYPSQPPTHTLPPHLQRLQRLIRGLCRTLDDDNWLIHWGDDGHICWLLNILPLGPPPPFPDQYGWLAPSWYPQDQFPNALDQLTTAAQQWRNHYQQLTPQIGDDRPLLHLHQQTPYINLDLLADITYWANLSPHQLTSWSPAPLPQRPTNKLSWWQRARAQRHYQKWLANLPPLTPNPTTYLQYSQNLFHQQLQQPTPPTTQPPSHLPLTITHPPINE
ncbi:MAG TPA: hypothetical protein VLL52_13275 [Anaerolineae bacterium]|nr:hypothetical protein [Anaerolineae bacterium]